MAVATLSPLLTRGSTSLALTIANGIVLSKLDEETEWTFEAEDRLFRAGSLIERNLFSSEGLRIRGLVRGVDIAESRTRLGNLLDVLGEGLDDVLFRIYDDREIRCRVEDVRHEWPGGAVFLQSIFEFTLRSADPFWRALTATTLHQDLNLASVSFVESVLTNTGNAPAPFTLDLTSPVNLSTVTVVVKNITTGKKFRIGKIDLVTPNILRFDTEKGIVTDGTGAEGVAGAKAEYVDGSFWLLNPGANTVRVLANASGTPDLDLDWSFRARHRSL
jgi:hypothetical protein